LITVVLILTLNYFKTYRIYNLPFNLPNQLRASTIPPLGTFMSKQYKNSKQVILHEKYHWYQYEKMGLISFYYEYLTEYVKKGRFDHWMEKEAREATLESKKSTGKDK
jgi:hypothetical protein